MSARHPALSGREQERVAERVLVRPLIHILAEQTLANVADLQEACLQLTSEK
jgi:hypothetical protein